MKIRTCGRFLFLLLVLWVFALLAGCGGGGGGSGASIIPSDSSDLPQITGFTPTSGQAGTTVTITGSNFNPSPLGTAVLFNGTGAVVSEATETQLVVTVPSGAATGPISVATVAGTAVSPAVFSVTGSSGEVIPQTGWTRRQSGAVLSTIAANDNGIVGFGGQFPAVSADGIDWTLPTALWSSINDLVWGGSLYVAAGGDGIYTSPDGMTWTERYQSAERLNGIAWSGEMFVAVGIGGTVCTSPDGISWTAQAVTADDLEAIAWAGGKFVATTVSSGNLFTSADGINWQSLAAGIAGSMAHAVAGSGELWIVTYANGNFITSPDAVTWTQHIPGTAAPLYQIAWSPVLSKFAAVSLDGQIFTSADGISWTVYQTHGWKSLDDVIWVNDRFVVVGSGDVLSSADGENWTLISDASSYSGVAWSGDKFVAVGDGSTIATSADGLAWSFVKNDSVPPPLTDIVWSGNGFVATGESGLYLSADGVQWTQTHNSGRILNAVAWSGEKFVAVGAAGQIFLSPDGTNWSSHTLPAAIELADVAWTGSRFVAVGEVGAVYSSEDGVTWSLRNSGTTETLNSVAWSGSRLVAAGERGVLTASVDGINWTNLNFLFNVFPFDFVSWLGDEFVTVTFFYVTGSPDGVDWSHDAVQTEAYMHAAAFSPARKVLVGEGGTFYSAE